MERIDEIKYEKDDKSVPYATQNFIDSPSEFLVRMVAEEIKCVKEFKTIFSDAVFPWRKQDFSIRGLPALRIYNETYVKQFDSWFIEGDLLVDIIIPANIRFEETQQVQDTLSTALLQQFRRPTFFNTLCEKVPGLNELGKSFSANKALGFEWNNTVVPLTQLTINFRIDLREWDRYLTDTNRTKDIPFEPTLGDLKKLITSIEALKDDFEKELEVEIVQKPGEEPVVAETQV